MTEIAIDWSAPLYSSPMPDICLVGLDKKFVKTCTVWLKRVSSIFAELLRNKAQTKDEGTEHSYLEVPFPSFYLELFANWLDPTLVQKKSCAKLGDLIGLAEFAEAYDIDGLKKHLCKELISSIQGTCGDIPIGYWGVAIRFAYVEAEVEVLKRLSDQPLHWKLVDGQEAEVACIPPRRWKWLTRQMLSPAEPLDIDFGIDEDLPRRSSKVEQTETAMDWSEAAIDWSESNVVFRTPKADLSIVSSDRKIIEIRKRLLEVTSTTLDKLLGSAQMKDGSSDRWLLYLPETSAKLVLLMKWMHRESGWIRNATITELAHLAELGEKYELKRLADTIAVILESHYHGSYVNPVVIWSLAFKYKYQKLAGIIERVMESLPPFMYGALLEQIDFAPDWGNTCEVAKVVNYWKKKLVERKRLPLK